LSYTGEAIGDYMAISPDGQYLYVPTFNSATSHDGTVLVISTSTNAVVTQFAVGYGATGIAIAPNNQTAYITNYSGSSMTVVGITN
jgi:DNA-binding beta-propeller fold protein YncE